MFINKGFSNMGGSMLKWNKTSCLWGINEILFLFKRFNAIMYGIWHRSNVRCGFARWHGFERTNFQWLCCKDPTELEQWPGFCWLWGHYSIAAYWHKKKLFKIFQDKLVYKKKKCKTTSKQFRISNVIY